MAEKTSFRTVSTFVPLSNAYIKHNSVNMNSTVYSKNITRQGTPGTSEYICMANRRKYVYNEKK